MTSQIDLGADFDSSVLELAGLDPLQFDPGTIRIDMVPDTGNATIRATRVVTVPAAALRALIVQAAS